MLTLTKLNSPIIPYLLFQVAYQTNPSKKQGRNNAVFVQAFAISWLVALVCAAEGLLLCTEYGMTEECGPFAFKRKKVNLRFGTELARLTRVKVRFEKDKVQVKSGTSMIRL
jgi:hypothetical protein